MIEMNKKYQTRDGRPVRILCVDGANDLYPVVGFIDGQVWTYTWKADGTMTERADCRVGNADLIPSPTKHEGWAVVITNCDVSFLYDYIFMTKQGAENWLSNDTRTGSVIPITFED